MRNRSTDDENLRLSLLVDSFDLPCSRRVCVNRDERSCPSTKISATADRPAFDRYFDPCFYAPSNSAKKGRGLLRRTQNLRQHSQFLPSSNPDDLRIPRHQERAPHHAQCDARSELPVRRLARLQRWREVTGRAALAKCGDSPGGVAHAASSDEPEIGPAVAQHA